MPYKDIQQRRKATADSMRKRRSYEAALAAGHPKAHEAERLRAGRSRPPRRSEIEDVKQWGAAFRNFERYLALRAEVIAEAEMFQ